MKRIFLIILFSFNYSFSQCEIRFMELISASKFTNEQDFLKNIAKKNNFIYDPVQDKFICEYFNEIKLSKVTSDRTYIKYEFQNKAELNYNLELFKTYGTLYKTEMYENIKNEFYFILNDDYVVAVNTLINNDTKSKDFLKEKYTISIAYLK